MPKLTHFLSNSVNKFDSIVTTDSATTLLEYFVKPDISANNIVASYISSAKSILAEEFNNI